ncbi:MAG TPA: hypothetical protein VGW74_09395 [Propionibacteriaceae bacterium]|nr:hypothetical protein [Propionibacteriaceae bacterium]
MAGDFEQELQALRDKVETDRYAMEERMRGMSETLVRHGGMLAKLDEGLGRVETTLSAQDGVLAEILRRLPPASE